MEKMTIKKIISGGQTGADQGGLLAAEYLSLQTGGMAPKKFMTEIGPAKTLLQTRFNLIEDQDKPKYGESIFHRRTEYNVINSDGTALFGRLTSTGSRLTLKCVRKHKKLFVLNPTAQELREFLFFNDIKILNVAGNRESINPGISSTVFSTIVDAISGYY